MAVKFSFTKRRLDALVAPAEDREYVQDEGAEGLFLCITRAGTKTFYLVKWQVGKGKVRVPLGKFPTMSVEDARKECRKLVAKISDGIDVQQARNAKRHEPTIQGLWDYWLDCARTGRGRKDNKPKKPKSIDEDERQYNAFLKAWSSKRLSTVRKSDVQALHTKIGADNGVYSANRLLALLKAMYNKAGDIGYTCVNPAVGIERYAETARDRFLRGDELPAFFQALAAESNTGVRDFILLALLTGARMANVLAMRWRDVDLKTAYWLIPETKSGRPVVVPLLAESLLILERRKKDNGVSPWVFPSPRQSKSGHLTYPQSAWEKFCERAGLQDVRIHDIRRTLGSYMANNNVSETIIGKMLGHRPGSKATAIYARLSNDPVRSAVESAASTMLGFAGVSINGGGLIIDVKATEGKSNGKA